MANADLALITGALAQTYGNVVRRGLNTRAVALGLMAGKALEKGVGQNVAWVHELSGDAAETYSDGADASTHTVDTNVTAVLTWGLYRSNGTITNLARDAAGSAVGPADLIRMAGRQLENKSRALSAKLGTDFFSGTGANTMIGLDTALRDDNTYATVNRASSGNAKFRGNLFDPGVSTPITLAQIRADISAITDACGMEPDLAFCCTAVWDAIANLFDSTKQFSVATNAQGEIVLNGGVTGLRVGNTVFVKDRLATANQIYYVNSDAVKVMYLAKVAVPELGDAVVEQKLQMTGGELPLGMYIEALARVGAASKFSCYVTAQLKVEQPNACGMRLHVAT